MKPAAAQVPVWKDLVACAPREARTAHKFAGLADLARSGDKNGATLRVSPEMNAIARELRTGKTSAIAVRPTSFWSLR